MKLTESLLHRPLRTVRRIVIALVGGSVLLLGVALLVLPGPAFIVIPVGLTILAVEFAWARRLLKRAKARVSDSFKTRAPVSARNSRN